MLYIYIYVIYIYYMLYPKCGLDVCPVLQGPARCAPWSLRGLPQLSQASPQGDFDKKWGCQPGCHSGKAVKTAISGYNYIIVSLKNGMN